VSKAGKNLSKDPWSTCGSCRFWNSDDEVIGRCLRNAPSVVVDMIADKRIWAVWPMTAHDDVCGEFAAESDK
jgi:hypothetical protein